MLFVEVVNVATMNEASEQRYFKLLCEAVVGPTRNKPRWQLGRISNM